MWRQAVIGALDDRTLQALVEVIKDYVDHWGTYPTPAQIRATLNTDRHEAREPH